MGLRSPSELLDRRPRSVTQVPEVRPFAAQIDREPIQKLNAQLDREIKTQAEERKRLAKLKDDFLLTDYENQLDLLTVNAEEKVLSAKGANVVENVISEEETLKKGISDIGSNRLRNASPEVQMRAALIADKKLNQFKKQGIKHGYSEMRKVEDQAYKTRVASEVQSSILDSSDVTTFEVEGLANIRRAVIADAYRTYGTDLEATLPSGVKVKDMIKQEVISVESDAISRAIHLNVASGNLIVANELNEKLNGRLTVEDKTKVEKALVKGEKDLNSTLALNLSQKALASGADDLSVALEYINDHAVNPEVRKEAISIARVEHDIRNKQKILNEGKVKSQIWEEFNSTGRVNPELLRRIESSEDRSAFIDKLNSASGVLTDRRLLDVLSDDMSKMTPEQRARVDLNQYRGQINSKDLSPLEAMKRSAQKEISGNISRAQVYDPSVPTSITREVMQEAKELDIKDFPGEGTSRYRNLNSQLNSMIQRIYEDRLEAGTASSRTQLRNEVKARARQELLKHRGTKSRSILGFIPWMDKDLGYGIQDPESFRDVRGVYIPEGRTLEWSIDLDRRVKQMGLRPMTDAEKEEWSRRQK